MTNVDELQRTLEYHAELAPDGKGVVEAAKAIHRRRRRRTSIAAVTAAAVLVGTVPLVVNRFGHPGPVTPAVSPAPVNGNGVSLKLTLDLLPGQSAAKVVYGVYYQVQYLTVRPQGSVIVYDPANPMTNNLRDGVLVKVRGHIAYYNSVRQIMLPANVMFDVLASPSPGSPLLQGAVSWQDPSGAWVVVYGAGSLAALLGLADLVRLDAPSQIVAPYHLGYLPRGAHLTFAQTTSAESDLAFDGTPRYYREDWPGYIKPPLMIKTVTRTPAVDAYQKGQPPTLKIAGHDAWWYTDSQPGPFAIWKGSAHLFVNAGNCQMQIGVADVSVFPLGELKRMVESARFKDCANGSTWVPPF